MTLEGFAVLVTCFFGTVSFIQNIVLENSRNRPYVVAYAVIEDQVLWMLYIKNIGKSPALDISLDFDGPLVATTDDTHTTLKEKFNHIPMLAPEQHYKYFLDKPQDRIGKPEQFPQAYMITVKYSNTKDKPYTERCYVDLRSMWGVHLGFDSSATKQNKILKELSRISAALEKDQA